MRWLCCLSVLVDPDPLLFLTKSFGSFLWQKRAKQQHPRMTCIPLVAILGAVPPNKSLQHVNICHSLQQSVGAVCKHREWEHEGGRRRATTMCTAQGTTRQRTRSLCQHALTHQPTPPQQHVLASRHCNAVRSVPDPSRSTSPSSKSHPPQACSTQEFRRLKAAHPDADVNELWEQAKEAGRVAVGWGVHVQGRCRLLHAPSGLHPLALRTPAARAQKPPLHECQVAPGSRARTS